MKTCEQSAPTTSSQLTSSAGASRVRTSRPPARELALLVLAAVSGTSLRGSLPLFGRDGSSWRMWRAVRASGLTLCAANWNGSAMKAYRSRLRLLMLGPRTDATASSLWPTPTTGRNMLSPSTTKWRAHARLQALLPTPTAANYGSNQGGGSGSSWSQEAVAPVDGHEGADANAHQTRPQGGIAVSGPEPRQELAGGAWSEDSMPEPAIRRMDDGLSARMDRNNRIKALGNAVVPQCAEVVGWVIRELLEATP